MDATFLPAYFAVKLSSSDSIQRINEHCVAVTAPSCERTVLSIDGYSVGERVVTADRTVDALALAGLWALVGQRYPGWADAHALAAPSVYKALLYVVQPCTDDTLPLLLPAFTLFGVRVRYQQRRVLKLPFKLDGVIYYLDEFDELGELDQFDDLNPRLWL